MRLSLPTWPVHLVIASRSLPPLIAIARLRVESRLVELGEQDLRFTPAKAASLFEASGHLFITRQAEGPARRYRYYALFAEFLCRCREQEEGAQTDYSRSVWADHLPQHDDSRFARHSLLSILTRLPSRSRSTRAKSRLPRNSLLGEFLFDGLEPKVPGRPPSITVEFDLDLNGILNVAAVDRGSGKEHRITVKAEHKRMNATEKTAAAEHIAGLTVIPQPTSEELAALLSRAQHVLDTKREGVDELQELVEEIEDAIAEGHTDDQAQLTDELLDLLYDLEDE